MCLFKIKAKQEIFSSSEVDFNSVPLLNGCSCLVKVQNMSMEKRLMQKLLLTNHQLTAQMNNWCQIKHEVNKTCYRNCKAREVKPVRQLNMTCLMQDFICTETE